MKEIFNPSTYSSSSLFVSSSRSSVLVSIVGETPSQGDGGLSWLTNVFDKESYVINLSKLRTLPFFTLAHNQISLLHLKQMLDKIYIINYN